jgi:hypothetical protein
LILNGKSCSKGCNKGPRGRHTEDPQKVYEIVTAVVAAVSVPVIQLKFEVGGMNYISRQLKLRKRFNKQVRKQLLFMENPFPGVYRSC